MGKFNKKYIIIIIILLFLICAVGLLIAFYNSEQNTSIQQATGPIVKLLCKKSVDTANNQCNSQKSILQNKYTADLAIIKKNYDIALQQGLKTSQDALKIAQDALKPAQEALKTSQAETTLCNTNLTQTQNSLKSSQDETTLCNNNLAQATTAKDKCDSDLTKSKNELSICEVNYADYGDQIADLQFLYNESRKARDLYQSEMQKYIEKSNQCTLDLDAKTTQFNTSQSNYDKCTADLGISQGKLQDSVAQYDNCNTDLTTTKATLDDTNSQLSDAQYLYQQTLAARDSYLQQYNKCQIDLENC